MYSYTFPAEELIYDTRNQSPDRPSSPLQKSEDMGNTRVDIDSAEQADNKCPLNPEASSDVGGRSSSVYEQISDMLQKLEQISHTVPTTSDRLSTISGLFPDGHGPSAEVVKVETENEAKSLDSLRSSIISLQSLFDDFRSKQDAFCMSYEREAVTIETNP